MQTLLAITEIQTRAQAIGVSISELSKKAGLSPSTALRLVNGRTQTGWVSTRQKLVKALTEEEARVRDHLQKLQGDAA
jgi:DNA-binding MurR/RpiR family transcriptional regulator